jgi:hypothetical protein
VISKKKRNDYYLVIKLVLPLSPKYLMFDFFDINFNHSSYLKYSKN